MLRWRPAHRYGASWWMARDGIPPHSGRCVLGVAKWHADECASWQAAEGAGWVRWLLNSFPWHQQPAPLSVASGARATSLPMHRRPPTHPPTPPTHTHTHPNPTTPPHLPTIGGHPYRLA